MANRESGPNEPRGFKKAYETAKKVVEQEGKVSELLRDAEQKVGEQKSRLNKAWSDVNTLIRVVKAWSSGTYTKVPWKALVYMLAALVYFVNPFDLVFDMIPGIGFIDDISVIGFVIAAVKSNLEEFRQWEIEQATAV